GDQMSEIRKQGRSSKARRNRTIRIAPMTKAVRSALATSTLVLALGAAGNVSAADHALSRAQVQLLRFEQATLDTAPVFDLTTVPQGLIGPGAPAQSLIGPADGRPGTVVSATSKYSDGTGETTYLGGVNFSASSADYDVHAMDFVNSGTYSTGNAKYVNVLGGGSVSASSYAGEAVGIYVRSDAGSTVPGWITGVSNTADITADGYTDAAGIAVFGVDDVAVTNTGTIYATANLGNAYGVLGVTDVGDVVIDNDADIDALSFDGSAFGLQGI